MIFHGKNVHMISTNALDHTTMARAVAEEAQALLQQYDYCKAALLFSKAAGMMPIQHNDEKEHLQQQHHRIIQRLLCLK